MVLRVSGKNLDIGESLQVHARERVGAALAKYFDREATGHVTLQPDGSAFRADMVLHLPAGITLQSEGHAHDPYATVNQAVERLEKRLRRHKRRLKDRSAQRARPDATLVDAPEPDDLAASAMVSYRTLEAPAGEEVEADFSATVVAESGVAVRTLSVSAAVLELDMSGAQVLMFRPSAAGELNVVYRRSDGHIGWIDPSKPAGGLADRP
ncbi:ribosome-associated translation inhibitor RaiA [Lichenibacterium minor]|uniref:Ribosome hibernation promoting factor n=1 Tax=Lichenibacterium minor TaxID=2316528 RepID=A0A4Q2U2S4_9HYPH|nr:ribosome-associated translation inhibitor RaiA [Lichenibacterium minor]RYC30793.1 ribosome-associated translation inhibitor RaiA [Lichenibacterium minor]